MKNTFLSMFGFVVIKNNVKMSEFSCYSYLFLFLFIYKGIFISESWPKVDYRLIECMQLKERWLTLNIFCAISKERQLLGQSWWISSLDRIWGLGNAVMCLKFYDTPRYAHFLRLQLSCTHKTNWFNFQKSTNGCPVPIIRENFVIVTLAVPSNSLPKRTDG